MADTNQHTDAASSTAGPDHFEFAVQADHKWYRRTDVLVPVVIVLLGLTILATVGGSSRRYRSAFQPPGDMLFSWDYFFHLVPQMLQGLYITARATVLGFLIAATLGLVLAL